MSVLIVIPTLNEEAHIGSVLDGLSGFASRRAARVVVADGGSEDRTQEIVTSRAQDAGWLTLLDNPGRLQSAAVNLAVETYGQDCEWLIRIDAHSAYPQDFCDLLLEEARQTDAASVVVTMHACGNTPLQRIIASAQNSRFGNGSAAHRNQSSGAWVAHGHHALMKTAAFRAVGGYDSSFSHNEDAELDYRLSQAGYRIWLTSRTEITYFPRSTIQGLVRQYFLFGRGRARNLAKHRMRPGMRQMIVATLFPALLLTLLTPLNIVFAGPLFVWLLGCLLAGWIIVRNTGTLENFLAGPIAGLMQLAWSVGFWVETLMGRRPDKPAVCT